MRTAAPSRSLILYVMLGAVIATTTIYPLYRHFYPADDYAIYEYFAEAVDEGQNPYAIEPGFRSDIVPKFFDVGGPQLTKGVIAQSYADYPPLLYLINSLAFRTDHLKGLYDLFIALYGIAIALYAVYAISRPSEGSAPAVTPLLFLLFFGTNPIFYSLWFSPIADKAWFAFFMMALLLFRNKPYGVTVLLGLFAATQGLGIPIMALYVLHLWVNKKLRGQEILLLLLVFGAILALSHVPWFPDWRNGYFWRADRQTYIGHESLFVPLEDLGLDVGILPQVLTALFLLFLAVLVARRHLVLEEVFLLPVVASIIFGPEATLNRLLVIVLAMLLLARHHRTILISYVLGAFLSLTGMTVFSWRIMWGWILFLLVETGLEIWRRNRTGGASEVQPAGAGGP